MYHITLQKVWVEINNETKEGGSYHDVPIHDT